MAKLVCLANSRKHGNRCIAGINLDTKEWIRPVSDLWDGAIGGLFRYINVEPQLLDILRIPLGRTGPDFGFQPENKSLTEGKWEKIGNLMPDDILQFCEQDDTVLYNMSDRVDWKFVQNLSIENRKSLQLVHSRDVRFLKTISYRGRLQVRADFTYKTKRYNLVVTDSVIERRVAEDERISQECILTISLGGPFPEEDPNPSCYKLVAGVIEM